MQITTHTQLCLCMRPLNRGNAIKPVWLVNQIIALFKFESHFQSFLLHEMNENKMVFNSSNFHIYNIIYWMRSVRPMKLVSFPSLPFRLIGTYRIYLTTFFGFGKNCFESFLYQLKPIYRSFRTVWDAEQAQGKWAMPYKWCLLYATHQMAADRRKFPLKITSINYNFEKTINLGPRSEFTSMLRIEFGKWFDLICFLCVRVCECCCCFFCCKRKINFHQRNV